MATSLDALEALLQIRESNRPLMPVPNPLDPAQPNFIEGDTPTCTVKPRAFCSGAVDTTVTVPNPLATSTVEKYAVTHRLRADVSSPDALSHSSTQNDIFAHGLGMLPLTPMPVILSQANPLEVQVRTDNPRETQARTDRSHAPEPRRGEKRRNQDDLGPEELTRSQNREYAKSTRLKKKERLEILLDTESKYLLFKEEEALGQCRIKSLVHCVENRDCFALKKLAGQEFLKPRFSVIDSVALSADNSAMVRVSARETASESANPKTLSGVICVVFTSRTSNIETISLYLSAPKIISCPVGMSPSVSVLSFET